MKENVVFYPRDAVSAVNNTHFMERLQTPFIMAAGGKASIFYRCNLFIFLFRQHR